MYDHKEQSITLDLRSQGTLEPRIGRLYDRLTDDVVLEYNEFIAQISLPLMPSLDWWVEAPASRNQLLTRLFHLCVCVRLVETLVNHGITIKTVMVDKKADSVVFEGLLRSLDISAEIIVPAPRTQRLLKWLRERVSPVRSIIRLFGEFLLIKFLTRKQDVSRDGKLILIDTFVLPGFIEQDRYYPGLREYISTRRVRDVLFVPQFMNFGLFGLSDAVRRLANSPVHMFKERHLTLRDMVWCASHWIRVRRLPIPEDCSFGDHANLRPLVIQELRSSIGFRCAVRGLLNYCFAQNLRRTQFSVIKAIDWFENHPMDRGWNTGFRRSFPNAKLIGYQGFHATFLGSRPVAHERDAGVLPATVAVMGKAFEVDLKETMPDLTVEVAPAFRYAWLWDEAHHHRIRTGCYDALVALPYDKKAAEHILQLLVGIKTPEHIRYVIKPHPGTPIDIENTISKSEIKVKRIDDPLERWYTRACVMITGGITTAGLEAMAVGVPAIHVTRPGRRYEIRIPRETPKEWFAVCDAGTSLQRALEYFLNRPAEKREHHIESAKLLRRAFFEPVTEEGIIEFLSAN